MEQVSTFRLYVLRAAYLLVAVGLGVMIWPDLLRSPVGVEHMRGVVRALLGAVALLALLGLRYPLRMIPLLLFELAWKAIWILAIGVPLQSAGALDAATRASMFDCIFGVVILMVAIPWGYVVRNYVRNAGDPWGRRSVAVAAAGSASGAP